VYAHTHADRGIAASHHQEVQSALDDVSKRARTNAFRINTENTVTIMKMAVFWVVLRTRRRENLKSYTVTIVFRKGGRVSTKYKGVFYEGERLAIVNSM
jgi:hypothetical protein